METCNGVITSLHAFRRMFERGIAPADVALVITTGETIKEYPDDKPYASKLIFKMLNNLPLHVVMAKDETGTCIVITVYIPDTDIWNPDFRTKKQEP